MNASVAVAKAPSGIGTSAFNDSRSVEGVLRPNASVARWSVKKGAKLKLPSVVSGERLPASSTTCTASEAI